MQISIDEVVLLEATESGPDLPGPHGADPVDALQIALRGPDDGIERTEIVDDAVDDGIGQPRDVREDAVAAR